MCSGTVTAVPVLHVENERVRVTEWQFAIGAETGFHVHEYDYTIVPLHPGVMRLTGPDGDVREVTLIPGVSYFRAAGTAHNVVNIGGTAFAFVEVELKEKKPE
ncbi:cupin domain-containing protein [Novispirillum itersonii]|uniref:cupin domain-containing protein n=1 Tax=Novispirillum itersonii TaxID=189 RepID=UPI000382E4B6|nr:cupin domain-containing protein [Novispirillum itersonii]